MGGEVVVVVVVSCVCRDVFLADGALVFVAGDGFGAVF